LLASDRGEQRDAVSWQITPRVLIEALAVGGDEAEDN
jgi:predicted 3-demethylubiquinone-9 3-methyltransferase (glyoxalase superfamily)